MNIRPLADRVVVKPLEEEASTSPGGIIIPDTAKEKPQQGEIVEVGPGRKTEEGKVISLEVNKGDKVKVKLLEVDSRGKMRLSRKALLDKPTAESQAK